MPGRKSTDNERNVAMSMENGRWKKLLHGKTFAIRKSVVFALVGGLLMGVGGVLLFQWYNPKDESQTPAMSTSVIMSRIVERNEMVAASQDYTIVEKAGDRNKLFDLIDIPFTQNSFWYRYSGTIEATVDLSSATWDSKDEAMLVVTLPEPTMQNIPDTEVSGVLEEHNNALNPIHVEDVDAFQRDCIAKSNQQAKESGLLDEAKTNARENLQTMFDVALGQDYKIEIEWIDAKAKLKSE